MWTVLIFGLNLLFVFPVRSYLDLYGADNNQRPYNVTGLDYSYYGEIGSYYNGTLTLTYDLEHPSLENNGNTCVEFENSTFKINLKAMAGFKKVGQLNPSPNPFYLDIYGWDSAYNLTNDGETPEYSNYQEIHISSSYEQVYNETWWFYNMADTDSNAYRFGGLMSTFFLRPFQFKFNVSGICDVRFEPDELFSGIYLASGERNGEQYFSHPITTANITGSFDEQNAWVETSGYFTANNRGTRLIGWLDVVFQGNIDEERSDHLIMGEKKPEWNDTLGYEIVNVGVGTSEGGVLSIRTLEMLIAAAAIMIMLAR